jgi:formylglycine-generating enzyme
MICRTVSSFTAVASAWVVWGSALGCTCSEPGPTATDSPGVTTAPVQTLTAAPPTPTPQVLYVPDAAVQLPTSLPPSPPALGLSARCPPDMVNVRGLFCIDRFEVSLVDLKQGRELSPYYHPTFTQTRSAYRTWELVRKDMGTPEMQLLPLPQPPAFQMQENFGVRALALRGAVPNGHLSGTIAERACKNSGKRLCSEAEWVTACRGETDQTYPYGNEYVQGKCNVAMGAHPAAILHGKASLGHNDPRLNHFEHEGSSLLHATGSHLECRSRWGSDAVYDMVGNLDEWVDDEDGLFLGGFYARKTKDGCGSRVSAHPRAYFDYSLGARCCK